MWAMPNNLLWGHCECVTIVKVGTIKKAALTFKSCAFDEKYVQNTQRKNYGERGE
jgi:hypothetical protein